MSKKIIGILGGMGPAATADLFTKIINSTEASCDQEHLHVIIDSNTNIPDRTEALIHGGADPTEQMTQSARRLVEAGAELIVMPCNTAHGFYDAVCASVPVPVLHMIKLTAQELMRHEITRAGLLATDGTVQSGIYESCFAGSGIELITPSPEAQAAVMDLTYNGVKAGRRDFDTSGFEKAVRELFDNGVQTLILGCTELPPAFDMYGLDYKHIDPTLVLARAAVIAAGGKLREA